MSQPDEIDPGARKMSALRVSMKSMKSLLIRARTVDRVGSSDFFVFGRMMTRQFLKCLSSASARAYARSS